MLTVVKATERDGVTPKDGDIGERLLMSNIDKRFGLILHYPTSVDQLKEVRSIALIDPQNHDYIVRTSSIQDVYVNVLSNQIEVVTRNTIYYLEDVPN
jgi:hypothetical protein